MPEVLDILVYLIVADPEKSVDFTNSVDLEASNRLLVCCFDALSDLRGLASGRRVRLYTVVIAFIPIHRCLMLSGSTPDHAFMDAGENSHSSGNQLEQLEVQVSGFGLFTLVE